MALDPPTCWSHPREFVRVAEDFLSGTRSGWKRCLDTLKLWKHRVHRMPLGAEVTLYLVQSRLDADFSTTSSDLGVNLSSACALLRFLNLVSQLCERMLGLTRFSDAAGAAGVPGWMVRARHDIAHGSMPDGNALTDGVQFALRWLALNYWQTEAKALEWTVQASPVDILRKDPDYGKLRSLLECYGYLKVYSIWGTHSLKELRERQPEVFEHVSALWTDVQERGSNRRRLPSADGLKVREGLRTIVEQLETLLFLLDREDDGGNGGSRVRMIICQVLLTEELLLPKKDFFDSLVEEDDKPLDEALPLNLLEMWREVIVLVALRTKVFPDLLSGLFDAAEGAETNLERSLATGWLEAIVSPTCPKRESSTPKLKVGKKRRKEDPPDPPRLFVVDDVSLKANPRYNSFVNHCLDKPSPLLLRLLPHLSQLHTPPLSERKQQALSSLVSVYLGRESPFDKDFPADTYGHKTVQDLEVASASKTDNLWTLADGSGLPTADMSDGDELTVGDADANEVLLNFDSDPEWFVVPRVQWEKFHLTSLSDFYSSKDSETSAAPTVPAFYRNSSKLELGHQDERAAGSNGNSCNGVNLERRNAGKRRKRKK